MFAIEVKMLRVGLCVSKWTRWAAQCYPNRCDGQSWAVNCIPCNISDWSWAAQHWSSEHDHKSGCILL